MAFNWEVFSLFFAIIAGLVILSGLCAAVIYWVERKTGSAAIGFVTIVALATVGMGVAVGFLTA